MTSEKKSAIHTLELLQRLHKKTKRTSAPRPAFSPSVAPVLNPNVEATIGTNGEKELRERRKGEDTFTSKKRELFLKLKQRNTKELRSYVALADQITADYMQEIGLEPTHIDQKNVHFLQDPTSDFLWKQHGFNAGQTVVVNADLVHRPRQLLNTVIHELLHAKGFSFLHETSKEGLSRVSGVKRAEGPSASIVHFDGLNEAIVQLLTQRAFAQISDQHPLVAEHTDWQDSPEGEKALRRFEKRSRMDREFIFDVDRQGKMGGGRSYFHLVKTLRFVIESIYHDYQDTFKTPDDVTHVFGRALFDGNCEPLERLVNHAFGETAFLVLRDMGTDLADGQRTLLLLQKMRISELKQRKTRPSL